MATFKIAKTVMKSLFNKPATLMYPVVEREWQERTRGSIDIDAEKCILCGICSKKCPTSAIEVDRKGRKWEIKRMQCIQCGACVEACPKDCLLMNNKYTEPGVSKVTDCINIPEVKKTEPKKDDDKKADSKKEDVKQENTAAQVQDTDGDLVCNKDECVFCGLCAKACPCDALKVERKEKIWEVDTDTCVKCGACVEKCPKNCLGFGEVPVAEAEKESEGDDKPEADSKTKADDKAKDDKKEKSKEDKPAKAAKKTKKAAKKNLPKLDADKCIYCRACENECPEEAISAEVDEWTLDEDKCIGCGACTDVCPADALEL